MTTATVDHAAHRAEGRIRWHAHNLAAYWACRYGERALRKEGQR